jgi:ABC-type uncharacterized transport system substrate-binding protein
MDRRICAWLLATFLLITVSLADAQQPGKVPRIGIVSGTGNPNEPGSSIKLFRQALQELGYVEGKNILFEYRYTEGNRDRIPGILAELVSLKVDVIFSTQAIVIRAAKQATKTIPIVMAITPDPVAAGLVDSLARPWRKYHRTNVSYPRAERKTAGTTDRDDSKALTGRNPFRVGLYCVQRL